MEISNASNFILTPTPDEEARNFIKSKPVVSRRVFDKLTPELKCLAFTIGGIESMDILQRVRDEIAKLPEGKSWDDCKKDIIEAISPYLSQKTSATRAEMLLRMHGLSAFRVGQWELAQETKDSLPYFKYIATMDSKTRKSHAALHGLVLPVDDPFWDNHMPPGWDWGCRCQVVQISEYEKKEQEEAEKKLPLERRRVLNETQKKELRNGRLTTGPSSYVSVQSAFERDGGPTSLKNLKMPAADIFARYSKKTRTDFLNKLGSEYIQGVKGTYTVQDWLNYQTSPQSLNTLTFKEKMEAFDKIIAETPNLNTQEIIDRGREYFILPMAEQGEINIDYINKIPEEEMKIFTEGKAELEQFVKSSLLTKSPTVVKPNRVESPRSWYDPIGKFIKMDISKEMPIEKAVQEIINLKTFQHEFCHFLEDNFPELKKVSVQFLRKRTAGEVPLPLTKIKNNPTTGYKRYEIAYKDEWIEKGGDAYSGRYYKDPTLGEYYATEVLSMGLQRFLKNPILFYKQDKDYFEFVVKQIQGV